MASDHALRLLHPMESMEFMYLPEPALCMTSAMEVFRRCSPEDRCSLEERLERRQIGQRDSKMRKSALLRAVLARRRPMAPVISLGRDRNPNLRLTIE